MICGGTAWLGGEEAEDDIDWRRRKHEVGGFRGGGGGDHMISHSKSKLVLLPYWFSEVYILRRGETVNMKAKDVRLGKKICPHNLIYRASNMKNSKFQIFYLKLKKRKSIFWKRENLK